MIRHNFKKNYGQNFLTVSRFAEDLVDSLELNEFDVVIEIGPGDGMVTNILLNRGVSKVIAIEIDYDLLPNLIRRFSRFESFKLVHEDILKVDLNQLLKKYEVDLKVKQINNEKENIGSIKVVGSLPYNISKKIIDKFLQFKADNPDINLDRMSFIVQEEVAKDYTAQAPKASFLSNYLQIFANARKLKTIPAQKFYPKPQVNGAILLIKFKDLDELGDRQELAKFIRTGFSSPRKTLFKNLSNTQKYDLEKLKESLQKLGFKDTVRPAELSFEEFVKLFKVLN